MGERLSLKQGALLVKAARKSIEYALVSGTFLNEAAKDRALLEKRGVFVTLKSFPENRLRGCIGIPYPAKPLWQGVIEMAAQAALNDPRFEPVKAGELGGIVIEVSVLTRPEEITGLRKDFPKKLEIGKDGLVVKRSGLSGLLLPQVAIEQNWDAETFLSQCCLKAGLMQSMWQSKETAVFRFQAQVFSETEPKGSVEEC
jgi:hypothetical protein